MTNLIADARQTARSCALLVLTAQLAACGSGGGPKPAAPAPPPSPTVVVKLNEAAAHWLSARSLAWPGAPVSGIYRMYYAANGGIVSGTAGIEGADGSVELTVESALPATLQAAFPHLKSALALRMPDDRVAAKARLKGQLVLARLDSAGKLVTATSLQTAGVLDDLYAEAAAAIELGPTFDQAGVPTIRVWAPTAKSVKLNLYGVSSSSVDMIADPGTGAWSYKADNATSANNAYYTFSVQVFSRWADNKVVTNEVTDPYSVSTNTNGQRSLLANLDSAATKPAGWDAHAVPALAHPSDISLYELHVRDFSATDATVPAPHRGKYLAFSDTESNGMRHLKKLQGSGLTHIHLLPTADMGSVNESGCVNPVIPAAAADSDGQQAAVAAAGASDCFNWGYDPQHYNVPEGVYATDAADGLVRIREFRSMVKSLHDNGLRVAMDVVYNHTAAARQDGKSVLDKIVPGYYYRLNNSGNILTDSCCSDTASENAMMGKLVIDSIKLWTTAYKIDSVRFDLMGLMPLQLLKRVQIDVNAAADRPIFLYGEGWNYGAVENDARFAQARQENLAGTGIGSFNDRVRDAIRGGGCCDSASATVSQQGLINGAYYDRNAASTQSVDDLLRLADLARVGLAGSVKDYAFVDRSGTARTTGQISYNGRFAGYTSEPYESINYAEAHDNQTLYDINAYKLPVATSTADRVRVQNLGAALVTLAQGVPFYHAGQDLLRSKSLDRDSYNAGDWFNALDFSYQSNNFGVGLPLADKNQENWGLIRPLLTAPQFRPAPAQILQARDTFLELMNIRQSSTLFRLRSGDDVKQRLKFHNVGPAQVPGVIALRIDGAGYPGANYRSVVVLFNVDKASRSVAIPELKGLALNLHSVQRESTADTVVKASTYSSDTGSFVIPARSTAVFVE